MMLARYDVKIKRLAISPNELRYRRVVAVPVALSLRDRTDAARDIAIKRI